MINIIFELGTIIGIAAVIALITRAIKQPPIIAYLITGIVVGPLFLNVLSSTEMIETFARLGVAFLLFIVGLSLDFKVLREVGGVSVVAGAGAMAVVSGASFFIARALGFSFTPSLYLAAALAFSSTVVVVKLLSDKREMDTLHGRIALGILIVEDFVAALMLMIVPVVSGGDLSLVFAVLIKAVALVTATLLVGTFIVPRFFTIAASSQEVLFLASIAWALLIAILFNVLGFSLEIGALLAGMALASSKYTFEITGKMKGLRDFFVVLFFVYFGSLLHGPITSALLGKALVFSAFILIGKPLVVMAFMRGFGYKKRTNFFAGIGLAQISEFSLILILMGYTLGAVTGEVMSLAVLVAIITIALSSYSIHYSHSIFARISHLLDLFDGTRADSLSTKLESSYDVYVFGYHRIGYKVVQSLKEMKARYVVVDYNPKTILHLAKQGVDCIYGDAADNDFLREIGLENANLVISTIPEVGANIAIKESLRVFHSKAVFLATSEYAPNAISLYDKGADYVIMPHHLGGDFVADLVSRFKLDAHHYRAFGKEHRKQLRAGRRNSTYR